MRLDLDARAAAFGNATTVEDAAVRLLTGAPPQFVAIGFSLGGFVVLELLRRAPERLLGAVLIASHAEADTPSASSERSRQAALLAKFGATALIDDLWPRYVALGARDRCELRELVGAMAASFDADDFAAQSALAASRPDSRSGVKAGVRVLVLAGADDATCPPERSKASAAALGATFVQLPAVGHFVPLEAPDAAAAAIDAWLAGVRQDALLCC